MSRRRICRSKKENRDNKRENALQRGKKSIIIYKVEAEKRAVDGTLFPHDL